ncbi:hypothetical protein KIN20_036125 [Parelaphostrongylus tenuis]|uniref:Uncharacterized protein n=1 Tax=Parelaphostrongylus tenuis TaxID=148309 RepID=A0AAD5WKZ7_PARTN|nr:hypothetical protein KIN20_036125 [Parelaphostrongylus tenuis]
MRITLPKSLWTEGKLNSMAFLAQIIFRPPGWIDKELIFFKSQRPPHQGLSPDQKGTPTPQPRYVPKAMLIIFWDRSGPIHWDLLRAGQIPSTLSDIVSNWTVAIKQFNITAVVKSFCFKKMQSHTLPSKQRRS